MTNSQRIRELTYKAKAEKLQRQIDDIMSTLKDGTMYNIMMQSIYTLGWLARFKLGFRVIRGR